MENKTGNYFKYAIGEIVLVVIGILIALQINNWNTEHKDRIEERSILKELVSELTTNENYLLELKQIQEKKILAAKELLTFIENPETEAIEKIFYMDAGELENIPPFTPRIVVLKETIESNKLQLIQNNKIKYDLTDYLARLNSISGDFDYHIDYWKDIQSPYIVNNISRKEMYQYVYGSDDIKPSTHIWEINKVLQDKVFENITLDVLELSTGMKERLQELIDDIEMLKTNIKDNYQFND